MATMTRPISVWAAGVLALGVLAGFACAEEPVEIPESLYGEPVCMMASSLGHWKDGRQTTILNARHSLAPAGCACLPEEDRYAWAKEDLDMLAEFALAECQRMAEANYDFDWTDCQADFEAEVWYMSVVPVGSTSGWHAYQPDDLHCVPEP